MPDKKQVMFDIERCICHVPDACRDCSKYKGVDGLRCMEELMADAYALLKEQGTIVRCKDCKYWYFADNRIPCEQENVCGRNGIVVTPEWFCADGEREDAENH